MGESKGCSDCPVLTRPAGLHTLETTGDGVETTRSKPFIQAVKCRHYACQGPHVWHSEEWRQDVYCDGPVW